VRKVSRFLRRYQTRAAVVHSSSYELILEAVADSECLDKFIGTIRPYGEVEASRSGTVTIAVQDKVDLHKEKRCRTALESNSR